MSSYPTMPKDSHTKEYCSHGNIIVDIFLSYSSLALWYSFLCLISCKVDMKHIVTILGCNEITHANSELCCFVNKISYSLNVNGSGKTSMWYVWSSSLNSNFTGLGFYSPKVPSSNCLKFSSTSSHFSCLCFLWQQ